MALAALAALCACLVLAPGCSKKKPGTERAPAPPAAPVLDFVRDWGTDTESRGALSGPAALARLDDGGVLVLDRFNRRIQHYAANGDYLGPWGVTADGRAFPFTVLVDMERDPASGRILVAVNHRLTRETLDRSCGGVFHADTVLEFSPDGVFAGDPQLVTELEQSTTLLPAYQRRLNDDFWKRNEELLCLSTYGRIAANGDALPGAVVEVSAGPIHIVRPGGVIEEVKLPDRPGTPPSFCEAHATADGWLYVMGCLLRREVYRTRLEDLAAGRLYLDTFLEPPDRRTVTVTTDTRHNLFTALPDGGFAIYDARENAVLRYDARGNPGARISVGVRIHFAKDFIPEPDGGYLIADYVADSVARIGPDGRFAGRIGTNRAAPGQFAGHSFSIFRSGADPEGARPAGVVGVAADPGGRVFASDAHNRRVQVFDASGKYLDSIRVCGNAPRCFPADIEAANGAIYVTLFGMHEILKLDPQTGRELARWRVPKPDALAECSLCGMGADPKGNIFVSDGLHVYKLDKDLRPAPGWKRGALSSPALQYPADIAFDAQGRLYAAGTSLPPLLSATADSSAICRFSPALELEQCFDWGDRLFHPRGIAVSGNSLLVASSAKDTVIQSTLNGDIVQIWGGPGRENGMFQNPLGITANKTGGVFIADNGNERVQQFRLVVPK